MESGCSPPSLGLSLLLEKQQKEVTFSSATSFLPSFLPLPAAEKRKTVGLGLDLFHALFLQRSQLWLDADLLPPSTVLVKTLLPFGITCTP